MTLQTNDQGFLYDFVFSLRFGGYHHGFGGGYGFRDWNRAREIDGFMCRDSNDCNWIDRNLYCQDYELDFQPSVSCTTSTFLTCLETFADVET